MRYTIRSGFMPTEKVRLCDERVSPGPLLGSSSALLFVSALEAGRFEGILRMRYMVVTNQILAGAICRRALLSAEIMTPLPVNSDFPCMLPCPTSRRLCS